MLEYYLAMNRVTAALHFTVWRERVALLRRDPDTEGLTVWEDALNHPAQS